MPNQDADIAAIFEKTANLLEIERAARCACPYVILLDYELPNEFAMLSSQRIGSFNFKGKKHVIEH